MDLVPVDGPLGGLGGASPRAEGKSLDRCCCRVEPFDEVEIRATLARHGTEAGPVEMGYGAEDEGRWM